MDMSVPFSVQWVQGEDTTKLPIIPEGQRNNSSSMFSLPAGHYTIMAVVRSRVRSHVMSWVGGGARVLQIIPDSESTRERQIMFALTSTTDTGIRPEHRAGVLFEAGDLITLMFIPHELYSPDQAGGA